MWYHLRVQYNILTNIDIKKYQVCYHLASNNYVEILQWLIIGKNHVCKTYCWYKNNLSHDV